MISTPRPVELLRASSRIWFISPVRSSDSTLVEGTEPRTSRMAVLTIGSSRPRAVWMPPVPTACRKRTGSVIRQRAKASTTSRRSSSGVTSSGEVGRPRIRSSYFATLSRNGTLTPRPGCSCTSTTRPRRSTSAFSRSSTMKIEDMATTPTTISAGIASAEMVSLRAAISYSLRSSCCCDWYCRSGWRHCPNPNRIRMAAAADPAADRAPRPNRSRRRRSPRR